MIKGFRANVLLLSVFGSIVIATDSEADVTKNLTSSLIVEVGGFNNQAGQVCASLFTNSQGFPNNRKNVVQRQCTKITSIPIALTFTNLKAGSYAVAVIHDLNGDSTLNRNDLGMPIEGYGFSRNPETQTGPPKYNDSAILVAGSNTNVQIQLKYLN
jgi:uncharacterized protein (DUF2141 family)